MISIRRPSGLAAAAICAVATTLVFACGAPVNNADMDAINGRGGGAANGDGGVGRDGQSTTTTTTKTGLPCEVSEVLSKNCQTCHTTTPKSGASTALVTWDDLQKDHAGKKLYEVVKDRVHAEAPARMPPATRLTDPQIKAIDDWVASGAKESGATCEVEGPPPATRPFVCDGPGSKVTVMKASKSFTWTADIAKPDQYMCFGVDEVVGAKRHIVAMGPKIENLNIVHHVLLFQSKEAASSEPFECNTTETGKWKLVTGWAPGGGNLELPPEAGYPQEGTTHWIMQLHYNNASGKFVGESDNSGYQLCSTDQLRPNDAGTLAFGSRSFTIPPRTAKFVLKCDYKLNDKYNGVKFFAASPHMHTLGMAISTERLAGGNGPPELVFEQNPFNFENQADFVINKTVAPGDVMRTRCTWKNPTDKAVTWGEGTGDEMCFNFFAYYPAIPDFTIGPLPIQSWISPSLALPGGVSCAEEK